MQWKFSGNKPVYVQIMEHIRGAVLVGHYPPGSQVPPVREWAAEAKVNPNTMQRAMLELEREGLLVTCGTMGRFVTDDPHILEKIRQEALEQVVRSCAEQFRLAGLTLAQAAQLLLALEEKEDAHG